MEHLPGRVRGPLPPERPAGGSDASKNEANDGLNRKLISWLDGQDGRVWARALRARGRARSQVAPPPQPRALAPPAEARGRPVRRPAVRPRPMTHKHIYVCEECGEEFEWPHVPRFCSKSCSAKFTNRVKRRNRR